MYGGGDVGPKCEHLLTRNGARAALKRDEGGAERCDVVAASSSEFTRYANEQNNYYKFSPLWLALVF